MSVPLAISWSVFWCWENHGWPRGFTKSRFQRSEWIWHIFSHSVCFIASASGEFRHMIRQHCICTVLSTRMHFLLVGIASRFAQPEILTCNQRSVSTLAYKTYISRRKEKLLKFPLKWANTWPELLRLRTCLVCLNRSVRNRACDKNFAYLAG